MGTRPGLHYRLFEGWGVDVAGSGGVDESGGRAELRGSCGHCPPEYAAPLQVGVHMIGTGASRGGGAKPGGGRGELINDFWSTTTTLASCLLRYIRACMADWRYNFPMLLYV